MVFKWVAGLGYRVNKNSMNVASLHYCHFIFNIDTNTYGYTSTKWVRIWTDLQEPAKIPRRVKLSPRAQRPLKIKNTLNSVLTTKIIVTLLKTLDNKYILCSQILSCYSLSRSLARSPNQSNNKSTITHICSLVSSTSGTRLKSQIHIFAHNLFL